MIRMAPTSSRLFSAILADQPLVFQRPSFCLFLFVFLFARALRSDLAVSAIAILFCQGFE